MEIKKFIENIVDWFNIDVWLWLLTGVVIAVFAAGIVLMIIKKRAYPIGRSTAIAAVICAVIIHNFCAVSGEGSGVSFSTLILCVGGILALGGGLAAMILKKKHNKNAPTVPPAPQPGAYQPDNFAAGPIVPPYGGGYEGAANYPARQGVILPPDVEALLAKINRICAGGSTLTEMRDAATLLQKERAKPENKNNPEIYSRLNKALIALLNAIQKR